MKSNEILCEEIKQGVQGALETLLSNNEKLLYSLMNRFRYDLKEKEDLFSCAKFALIKAAQNFDGGFGCLFSTYAVPLVLGEIKKYFRDNSSLHVSRSYKDLYRIVMKAQEDLESKLQKTVSLYDISEYLNISIEDILLAYESHIPVASLDTPLKEDNDLCLMDTIDSKEFVTNQDLNFALDHLDKKEKLIIQLRYFEGLTQQEVAERFFLSQVQISRMEKKILQKLKEFI